MVSGRRPGADRSFNTAAGLSQTVLSSCVVCRGFPWPGWGLSTTTPADQIALLRKLITPSTLLAATERAYALSLMENVTPAQRWGVSGGVPAQVTVALKNGWLPLKGSDGDWQINSVGWVSGSGRNYLMAVLTTGNPTEQYGIDTIDQLATMVWQAMKYPAPAPTWQGDIWPNIGGNGRRRFSPTQLYCSGYLPA